MDPMKIVEWLAPMLTIIPESARFFVACGIVIGIAVAVIVIGLKIKNRSGGENFRNDYGDNFGNNFGNNFTAQIRDQQAGNQIGIGAPTNQFGTQQNSKPQFGTQQNSQPQFRMGQGAYSQIGQSPSNNPAEAIAMIACGIVLVLILGSISQPIIFTGISIPKTSINILKSVIGPITFLAKGATDKQCLGVFFICSTLISLFCLSNEALKRGKNPFRFGGPITILSVSSFIGLGILALLFGGKLLSLFGSFELTKDIIKTTNDINFWTNLIQANPLTVTILVISMVIIPTLAFNNGKSLIGYLVRSFIVVYFSTTTANAVFPVTNVLKTPFGPINVLLEIVSKTGITNEVRAGFFITALLLIIVRETLENISFDNFVYSVTQIKPGKTLLLALPTVLLFTVPKIWFGAGVFFKTTNPSMAMTMLGSLLVILLQYCDNLILGFQSSNSGQYVIAGSRILLAPLNLLILCVTWIPVLGELVLAWREDVNYKIHERRDAAFQRIANKRTSKALVRRD